MPFYTIKHYTNGVWKGDTCLTANDRPHAIRLGLETVSIKFPEWGTPDRWTVYRVADMNNAGTYIRAAKGFKLEG
jgi:hypothetical protein